MKKHFHRDDFERAVRQVIAGQPRVPSYMLINPEVAAHAKAQLKQPEPVTITRLFPTLRVKEHK